MSLAGIRNKLPPLVKMKDFHQCQGSRWNFPEEHSEKQKQPVAHFSHSFKKK